MEEIDEEKEKVEEEEKEEDKEENKRKFEEEGIFLEVDHCSHLEENVLIMSFKEFVDA